MHTLLLITISWSYSIGFNLWLVFFGLMQVVLFLMCRYKAFSLKIRSQFMVLWSYYSFALLLCSSYGNITTFLQVVMDSIFTSYSWYHCFSFYHIHNAYIFSCMNAFSLTIFGRLVEIQVLIGNRLKCNISKGN